MKKSIRNVEEQFEERIAGTLKELNLLREGYEYSVVLYNNDTGKNKRGDGGFEKCWDPKKDSIHIDFRRILDQAAAPEAKPERGELKRYPPESKPTNEQEQTLSAVAPTNDVSQKHPAVLNPLSDLIRALDRAESRPGYSFVALKWFRDSALPAEGSPWASEDSQRRTVLGDAIDKRLVLTSKIPNPRSAQFPVTAIRLNRLAPEVREILGSPKDDVSGFKPIPIRGENLSATVLRDRR